MRTVPKEDATRLAKHGKAAVEVCESHRSVERSRMRCMANAIGQCNGLQKCAPCWNLAPACNDAKDSGTHNSTHECYGRNEMKVSPMVCILQSVHFGSASYLCTRWLSNVRAGSCYVTNDSMEDKQDGVPCRF